MLDVGFATVELLNFLRIGVETHHRMALCGEVQRQRQAHVSATDDSDLQIVPCKMLRRSPRHLRKFSLETQSHIIQKRNGKINIWAFMSSDMQDRTCGFCDHACARTI